MAVPQALWKDTAVTALVGTLGSFYVSGGSSGTLIRLEVFHSSGRTGEAPRQAPYLIWPLLQLEANQTCSICFLVILLLIY